MSTMNMLHLWIGTTVKVQDSFDKYFELDYSTEGDFDDPEYKVCQFCLDLDEKWYDEDFLCNIPIKEKMTDVKELLTETPILHAAIQTAVARCQELGITEANALFYYTDAETVVLNQEKKYNGLTYIGCYESSLI